MRLKLLFIYELFILNIERKCIGSIIYIYDTSLTATNKKKNKDINL